MSAQELPLDTTPSSDDNSSIEAKTQIKSANDGAENQEAVTLVSPAQADGSREVVDIDVDDDSELDPRKQQWSESLKARLFGSADKDGNYFSFMFLDKIFGEIRPCIHCGARGSAKVPPGDNSLQLYVIEEGIIGSQKIMCEKCGKRELVVSGDDTSLMPQDPRLIIKGMEIRENCRKITHYEVLHDLMEMLHIAAMDDGVSRKEKHSGVAAFMLYNARKICEEWCRPEHAELRLRKYLRLREETLLTKYKPTFTPDCTEEFKEMYEMMAQSFRQNRSDILVLLQLMKESLIDSPSRSTFMMWLSMAMMHSENYPQFKKLYDPRSFMRVESTEYQAIHERYLGLDVPVGIKKIPIIFVLFEIPRFYHYVDFLNQRLGRRKPRSFLTEMDREELKMIEEEAAKSGVGRASKKRGKKTKTMVSPEAHLDFLTQQEDIDRERVYQSCRDKKKSDTDLGMGIDMPKHKSKKQKDTPLSITAGSTTSEARAAEEGGGGLSKAQIKRRKKKTMARMAGGLDDGDEGVTLPVTKSTVTKDKAAVSKDSAAVSKDSVAVTKDKAAAAAASVDKATVSKGKAAVSKDNVAVSKDKATVSKDNAAISKDNVAVTKNSATVTNEKAKIETSTPAPKQTTPATEGKATSITKKSTPIAMKAEKTTPIAEDNEKATPTTIGREPGKPRMKMLEKLVKNVDMNLLKKKMMELEFGSDSESESSTLLPFPTKPTPRPDHQVFKFPTNVNDLTPFALLERAKMEIAFEDAIKQNPVALYLTEEDRTEMSHSLAVVSYPVVAELLEYANAVAAPLPVAPSEPERVSVLLDPFGVYEDKPQPNTGSIAFVRTRSLVQMPLEVFEKLQLRKPFQNLLERVPVTKKQRDTVAVKQDSLKLGVLATKPDTKPVTLARKPGTLATKPGTFATLPDMLATLATKPARPGTLASLADALAARPDALAKLQIALAARPDPSQDTFVSTLSILQNALESKPDALESKPDALESKPDALESKPDALATKPGTSATLATRPDKLATSQETLAGTSATLQNALATKPDTLATKADALATKPDTSATLQNALATRQETFAGTLATLQNALATKADAFATKPGTSATLQNALATRPDTFAGSLATLQNALATKADALATKPDTMLSATKPSTSATLQNALATRPDTLATLQNALATRPGALATLRNALAANPDALATRPDTLATLQNALATEPDPLPLETVLEKAQQNTQDPLQARLAKLMAEAMTEELQVEEEDEEQVINLDYYSVEVKYLPPSLQRVVKEARVGEMEPLAITGSEFKSLVEAVGKYGVPHDVMEHQDIANLVCYPSEMKLDECILDALGRGLEEDPEIGQMVREIEAEAERRHTVKKAKAKAAQEGGSVKKPPKATASDFDSFKAPEPIGRNASRRAKREALKTAKKTLKNPNDHQAIMVTQMDTELLRRQGYKVDTRNDKATVVANKNGAIIHVLDGEQTPTQVRDYLSKRYSIIAQQAGPGYVTMPTKDHPGGLLVDPKYASNEDIPNVDKFAGNRKKLRSKKKAIHEKQCSSLTRWPVPRPRNPYSIPLGLWATQDGAWPEGLDYGTEYHYDREIICESDDEELVMAIDKDEFGNHSMLMRLELSTVDVPDEKAAETVMNRYMEPADLGPGIDPKIPRYIIPSNGVTPGPSKKLPAGTTRKDIPFVMKYAAPHKQMRAMDAMKIPYKYELTQVLTPHLNKDGEVVPKAPKRRALMSKITLLPKSRYRSLCPQLPEEEEEDKEEDEEEEDEDVPKISKSQRKKLKKKRKIANDQDSPTSMQPQGFEDPLDPDEVVHSKLNPRELVGTGNDADGASSGEVDGTTRAIRLKYCDNCGQEILTRVQACAGCKRVAYCNFRCQKASWKVHKKTCSYALRKDGKESTG